MAKNINFKTKNTVKPLFHRHGFQPFPYSGVLSQVTFNYRGSIFRVAGQNFEKVIFINEKKKHPTHSYN